MLQSLRNLISQIGKDPERIRLERKLRLSIIDLRCSTPAVFGNKLIGEDKFKEVSNRFRGARKEFESRYGEDEYYKIISDMGLL